MPERHHPHIAWITYRTRRLRYCGTAKDDHWLHHRATAINLGGLHALGLARTDGP